jgi:dolichol-phosphate mannosyltransferase
MSQRTLVTLATYNERENLPRLVEAIFAAAPNVDVLVIDDNSPDGTGAWCDEYAKTETRFSCVHRDGKQGLGTAILLGMTTAAQRRYDFVLNMDADFSHPPATIPALIAGMDSPTRPCDVMIGSRYIRGGKIVGWPLKRHFMSRAINIYARALLRLEARDCSGSFRCYRVATLQKLDTSSVLSLGYSFQEEILWRLARVGAVIREIPITFVERELGVSKINRQEVFRALGILLRLGLWPSATSAHR